MDDLLKTILTECVRQVPGLAILALVVWMFVKVIMRFIKHIEDRAEVITQMHKEHLDARNVSRQAIADNTVTMRENTTALNHLTDVVQRLKHL